MLLTFPEEGFAIHTFEPQVVVRLTGPAVGPGRLAARDLAVLALLLDQALLRTAQTLCETMRRGSRPGRRVLEELCRLYMVSWTPGSVAAGFDLTEPNPRTIRYGPIATESLKTFLVGLSELAAAETLATRIPHGFDTRVLDTCSRFSQLLQHGICAITFTAPAWPDIQVAEYDRSVLENIRNLIDHSRKEAKPAAEQVFFGEEAEIRGTISAASGRAALPFAGVEDSFWKSTPLEKLAVGQGVRPIADITELDAVFPSGDVFDDVLSDLLEDRAERRRMTRKRSP